MILKRLYSFSFLFFVLLNNTVGQQSTLILPIGHTDRIKTAHFSPDGKKIITLARHDNIAKIWDVQAGILLADLKGHTDDINSAQFSPDGKKIVTASADYTAKVWDTKSGVLLADLTGHKYSVATAQFSPDGKKIVTASNDHIVRIWDAQSGVLLVDLKGHRENVYTAEFSPDGEKIVTSSFDSTAKIWSAETGRLIADLKGHNDLLVSARFSPDGAKVLTDSKTARIWNAQTGALLKEFVAVLNKYDKLHSKFSPDGKKIITTLNRSVMIWDAQTGSLLLDIKGEKNFLEAATFSPDGKKIIAASTDQTVKIWDAQTGILLMNLTGHTNSVRNAEFSPDGKKIASASSDQTVRIWDAQTGALLTTLKGHTSLISTAAISPDGTKIAIASIDTTIKITEARTGIVLTSLKGHDEIIHSLQFSPDGKKILSASKDGTAKVWSIQSGLLLLDFKKHRGSVYQAQFSPDGKKIVTASSDKTAKVWDIQTGTAFATLEHSGGIRTAQFSYDGKKIVTASYDQMVKVWDVQTGGLLKELKGHESIVTSAEFSPDGKKIVSTSDDNTVKIWDAGNGNLLLDLKGYATRPYFASFSPDGKKIIVAYYDNSNINIWDISTGLVLKKIDLDVRAICQAINFKRNILLASSRSELSVIDISTGKKMYSYFSIDSSDYLFTDKNYRYDGTTAARKLLYFMCGDEVVELDQVKEQLWVPNLAERINNGETINATTLDQLNICGLTPEVENFSSKADEYYFKITQRRGGLGETVLYINGIEARRYKSADLKKNAGVYELVIKKADLTNFFIAGKENPVTVKAYTSDNTISSRGLIIKEDKTKEVIPPPNLYAVMVGVSDYKGEGLDLTYAAKDATDISAAVSNAAKKLLNTDSKEHVFMYNLTTDKEHYQLPEKSSIKKLLEEIGRKATANDILLIFFSGHGIMESEKKQFYFLTADASRSSATDAIADVGISTAELTEWIKPQNIKAQKRILIFDACNSGQAIKDFVKLGKEEQGYLAVKNDDKAQQIKAIDKLNEKSGLFILSASASNQSAYEMGRYSQGLLTYSLLKAIKQQPDILEDGKYLNVSRWFNAAEKTVSDLSKENGARQEPQIVSNTNFNIGVVDDDVMEKIILPQEKPLFAASNFQNADEAADGDNLELSKLINLQLNEISSKGTDSKIIYVMATNSPDAYTLSGRYDVKGNDVILRISIKKNNETKYRFEEKGLKSNLKELANTVVAKAAEWASVNK